MDGWKGYLRAVREHLEELRLLGIQELALPRPDVVDPRSTGPASHSEESLMARPTPSRTQPAPAEIQAATLPSSEMIGVAVARGNELEQVAREIAGCTRCVLHKTRTCTVPGTGNPRARLMFIGEGPGEDEDRQGLPFVGRAGQLLTNIIVAMGLKREDVFIANIVKCRPPNNRVPMLDEVEACYPFLQRQIETIGPEIIVTLGASASQALLQVTIPITKLRGNFYRFGRSDVMPTYHPAYLLRNPKEKRAVWQDMQKVMARLGLPLHPKGSE